MSFTPRPITLAIAIGVLGAACASTPSHPYDDAVRVFIQANSCPLERVTVHEAATATPPQEIAADPQRLALWHGTQAKEARYVVEGCGHDTTYSCMVVGGRAAPPCEAVEFETAPR